MSDKYIRFIDELIDMSFEDQKALLTTGKASIETLCVLLTLGSKWIQMEVIECGYLPEGLLDRYIEDSFKSKKKKPINEDVVAHLAMSPQVSSINLMVLYKTKDHTTCVNVAKNPNTSTNLLSTIYSDTFDNVYINRALASNPSVPTDVLEEMLRSIDPETRTIAESNLINRR